MNRKLFIGLSFFILLISLLDIKEIPFYKRLGLDFSNHYGFQHCPSMQLEQKSIYKIAPEKCPDFEARPFVYPPLMYELFRWIRLFDTFDGAYRAYLALSILSFFIIVSIWSEKNILSYLYGFGLFFTFPNLFLLERGNSDLFVVLLWSLAYLFYQKKMFYLVGIFLAIALYSKLYPLYALLVLSFFVFRFEEIRHKILKSFFITSVLVFFLDPYLWIEYALDVLPKWSSSQIGVLNLAHSLKSIPYPMIGTMLFFFILLSWIQVGRKAGFSKMAWVWSGGLALSTLNNGVSFDYNLVTLFPLAIITFDTLKKEKAKYWLTSSVMLLFFVTFASRNIFKSVDLYPTLRLIFIGLSMITIPFIYFDLSHEVKRLKYYFLKY